MRKYLFLLSIAFLFCGCSKSIEEKAKDLVTDNLSESVTNKESLQIISISVDSCFYDIVVVDKTLQEYQKLQNEYEARAAKYEYMVGVVQPKEQEILALLRPKDQKEFKCYKVSVKYKSESSKSKLKEHTASYYVKPDVTGIIKAIDLENDTCRHYKQSFVIENGNIQEMLKAINSRGRLTAFLFLSLIMTTVEKKRKEAL